MKLSVVAVVAAIATSLAATAAAGTSAPQPESGSPCAGSQRSWCAAALSSDRRARMLLAEMTQEEKFALMAGDGFAVEGHTNRNLGISRLGVPNVDQVDATGGVRHGKATAMPAPVSLAATFDGRLARRYAGTVADEARNRGNDILLGPGVNIHRVPSGGRNFEYFGEDPALASAMAVAYIEAVQRRGVIGSVKHYAANNQEGLPDGTGSRFEVNAVIDERTLREIYLPAFEAAVKDAGVGTVMQAYNRVNGRYMSQNCSLVRDILKAEWGFKGAAITDYFNGQYSTVESANCGNDLELPSPVWYTPQRLAGAVSSGRVSQATIDDHVGRLLRTMFAFGIFDRAPFPEQGNIDFAGHNRVARQVSERGITLLENKGRRLPLALERLDRIAVIGEPADDYAVGAGTSQVIPTRIVTPLEGIRARARGRAAIVYDDGTSLRRAARTAAAADVAIVVAATREGEGADRPCLSLAHACNPSPPVDLDGPGPLYGDQDRVIRRVAAAQKNTVVVLQSGTPVLMPWLARVKAVLEAWYPGQAGGSAIARVLFGDVNPSGKLPVTFPRRQTDTPAGRRAARYPGVADVARYSEGVFVGYRHYDERRIRPLFPFGHGLSYTSFGYRKLRLRRSSRGRVRVSITLTNTGRRAGREVAQVYLGMPDPAPGVRQPPRWLRAFKSVQLRPGRSRRVRLELTPRDFSYWNARRDRFAIAPGCYRIMVGSSSRDIRARDVIGRGGRKCR